MFDETKRREAVSVLGARVHADYVGEGEKTLVNRMIHPRREFVADHCVVDGGPIGGHNQNAGSMVVCTMMQRVLARRAARCKKGS